MSKKRTIPVVPVAGGSTTVAASLEDYLWDLRAQTDGVHIAHTSDGLHAQSDRIKLDGLPPLPTPPGNMAPEYIDVIHDGIEFRIMSSGIEKFEKLAVDHQYLRGQLADDVVVVVDDPFQHFAQAVHSVRAQAYFLQERLGFDAADALRHALDLHFGVKAEDIIKQAPRLAALLDDLDGAAWECNITQDDPWQRYPLLRGKVNADEVQRELDGIILARTRRCDRTRDLLRQVLPTVGRVIITFARHDWLASLPGVQFDPIALANELAPQRAGVSIVTGKYVDHRLDTVGDRLEHFEGFCQDAPVQLWNVLRGAISKAPAPSYARMVLPSKGWEFHWSAYAIAAIAMPLALALVILTTLVSWQFAMIMFGVLVVLVAEIVCIRAIVSEPAKEPMPIAEQPKPEPPAKPTDDLAKALADRGKPVSMNGHADHAHK